MTLPLYRCVCGRWHTVGYECTECTECPSCDRDLSHPGKPGHVCYTYADHRVRRAAYAERVRQSAKAVDE